MRVPEVFLLDEPLTHMDAGERIRLRTELSQLQHGLGVTVYVTHDQSQAMAIGDRVAVMRGGRIEQVDEPRTLYLRPANTFVASFMGEPAMNLLAGYIEQDAGRLRGSGRPAPALPRTPSGLMRGRSGPVTVGIGPSTSPTPAPSPACRCCSRPPAGSSASATSSWSAARSPPPR